MARKSCSPEAHPPDAPATVARRIPWSLAVPLGWFVVMATSHPFRERFEIDTDEGINLMKALLVARGHPLYAETWSDQPPLFTHVLRLTLEVFGFEVDVGRLLVLAFSATMLWAVLQIVRSGPGWLHAGCAVGMVVLLPDYPLLSVAVMVGLPALTFAMLALAAMVRWHATRRPAWLAGSAAALAASMLTKGFAGFMVVVFLAGLVAEACRERRAGAWKPPVAWLGAFAGTLAVALLILVGPSHLRDLIISHVAGARGDAFASYAKKLDINSFLLPAAPTMALASLGALVAFRKRYWPLLYFGAWAAGAYVILRNHAPVWYHHHLLASIPAAALAGVAIGEGIAWVAAAVRGRRWPTLDVVAFMSLAGLVLVLATVPERVRRLDYAITTPEYLRGSVPDHRVLPMLVERANATTWVLTDRPIYAFRAGLIVPPNLAVFSEKRLLTGMLTRDAIIDTLISFEPEQILIARFRFPRLTRQLERRYRKLTPGASRPELWVRRDLLKGADGR